MRTCVKIALAVLLIAGLASADVMLLQPDGAAGKDACITNLQGSTNYGSFLYLMFNPGG